MLGKIKISFFLTLVFVLLFITCSVVISYYVNSNMRKQALYEAEEKAKILLDKSLATHTYFSHKLKPNVFKVLNNKVDKDYFDPSWMSSTYVVREVDKYFKELNKSAYYYKECAINARSPENEADEFEREFIERLNKDPKLSDLSKIRFFENQPYLTVLRRGETMGKSCLRCHSTHDMAPGGLVSFYGKDRSFNRYDGEVVSAISMRIPLEDAYKASSRYTKTLLLILISVLGLFFLAIICLNRIYIFRPLSNLLRKVNEITYNEKYLGEEVPLPPGKELRELTESFNVMSKTIKKRDDELRFHKDNLEIQVKERTEELEISNKELERFAYVASHDLKEPLRVISSYTQILLEDYVKDVPPEAQEYKTYVDTAITRMGKLIDDILNLSRVKKSENEYKLVDSKNILESAKEDLFILIRENGASVEYDALPEIYCDPSQMRIVFENLINNSVKYKSDTKPEIKISAMEDESNTVFSVRDNGVGMKEEYQEKAFEIFGRLHSGKEIDGSGIGLSICKKIVELHKGKIWYESKEGEGTTFFVSLPRPKA